MCLTLRKCCSLACSAIAAASDVRICASDSALSVTSELYQMSSAPLTELILSCSAAVLGYALESFVDVWSSILVLWRFWDDRSSEAPTTRCQREKLASFGISLSVCSLTIICAIVPCLLLYGNTPPDQSHP